MPFTRTPLGENLFNLDPVNTKLTAPVSNISVQTPQDNTRNEKRVSTGLTTLATAFTKLAVKQQANQIHNDIITAELAAAYEQEMPGGLEPEAQLAYSKSVDNTTKGKLLQEMQNFLAVEGSEILHDDRVDRKTRMTSFKNQLLGIVNLGKSSISRVNAPDIFADLDAEYGRLVGLANVEIAKDKQEESLAVAASNIRQAFKENMSFATQLMPKISETDELGIDYSPAEYAKKVKEFHAGWYAKHINSKWFKAIVKDTARKNLGVSIQDIKATALTIVTDELLKNIRQHPELLDQRLVLDILNNVQGTSKGTTLQDEISAKSKFGKVLDGIKTDYDKNVASTLKALEKEKNDAEKDRDNRIANWIQDNIGNLTKEQAISLSHSINKASEQRAVTTFINTHFSAENKKSEVHPEFGDLVKYFRENFYDSQKETFNKVGALGHAGENGFSVKAANRAMELADPNTKLGAKRDKFFNHKAVQAINGQFKTVLTTALKFYDLDRKYQTLEKQGMDISSPLVRQKLGLKGEADQKIRRILDAQISLGVYLEDLIKNNPDTPINQLIADARNYANGLITEVDQNLQLGSTSRTAGGGGGEGAPSGQIKRIDIDKEQIIIKGHARHVPELHESISNKVTAFNANKGFYSFNKVARDSAVAAASGAITQFTQAQAELAEVQKEFKKANVAKKALIINQFGQDPTKLKIKSSIRDIAELVNPDIAVKRHLAALRLSGLKDTKIGSKNKFAQDDRELKLQDTYDVWDGLVDFYKELPKKAAKVIQPIAKEAAQAIQPTAKKVGKTVSDIVKGSPDDVDVKVPDSDTTVSDGDTTVDDSSFASDLVDTVKNKVSSVLSKANELAVENVEAAKKESGATKIKRGTSGVESLQNMDKRVLNFAKIFFNDDKLKDIWGDEKVITSALRTPKNKYYNKKSGHAKGKAIDVRISGWKGTPKDLLLKRLKPAIENSKSGWKISPSKSRKEYVVVKNQYWMKLTKGKETAFIEVVGGNQPHIHYHIDENNLEPGGKW